MIRLLLALLMFALSPAHAGDIYKWTDANGKVHFGDRAAGAGKAAPEVINPQVNVVESQMTRGAPPAVEAAPQSPGRPPALQEERPAPRVASGCQAQWSAFDDSRRCYEQCAVRLHDGRGWNTSNCQCTNVPVPNCRR